MKQFQDLKAGSQPSEERFTFLADTIQAVSQISNEALFFFGPDLKLSWANTQLTILTGRPLTDLIGLPVLELFRPADRELVLDLIHSQTVQTDLKVYTQAAVETTRGEDRAVEIFFISRLDRFGNKKIFGSLKDISIFKVMENRLLEVQQALQKIIEMGNDGILVFDQDYRVEFANQLASEMTGFPKNKLVGSDFRSLLSPEDRGFLSALSSQIRLTADENRRVCTQFRIQTASETQLEVEICLTLTHLDGRVKTYAYLRDLSERIRIENELRKTNDFLKNIILSSVDGIIAADMKGRIILFNQGAQQMLGYGVEEALQQVHITRIYTPGAAKEIMKKLRGSDWGGRGKLTTTQVSLVHQNGEVFPAHLSAALIYDEDGQEMASVGIFTDLRERYRMQKELEETQLKLLQSEKMASLGKLAAGVAHEINNPLGGILIYANMLLEETPEEDPRREDLRQIVEQTLRCKDIVKELLDFSRQTRHRWVRTDINQAIRQTVGLLGRQALFHNVQLVEELAPDLPPVIADPGQIHQILMNLIINAVDAMAGSGTLTLRTYPHPAAKEGPIVLEVIDTGCGIPEENLSKVFDPFFTTKEVGKGTGLGLSTVYGIIQEHQGLIEVKSRVGQGTVFRIHLPQERPGQDVAEGLLP